MLAFSANGTEGAVPAGAGVEGGRGRARRDATAFAMRVERRRDRREASLSVGAAPAMFPPTNDDGKTASEPVRRERSAHLAWTGTRRGGGRDAHLDGTERRDGGEGEGGHCVCEWRRERCVRAMTPSHVAGATTCASERSQTRVRSAWRKDRSTPSSRSWERVVAAFVRQVALFDLHCCRAHASTNSGVAAPTAGDALDVEFHCGGTARRVAERVSSRRAASPRRRRAPVELVVGFSFVPRGPRRRRQTRPAVRSRVDPGPRLSSRAAGRTRRRVIVARADAHHRRP